LCLHGYGAPRLLLQPGLFPMCVWGHPAITIGKTMLGRSLHSTGRGSSPRPEVCSHDGLDDHRPFARQVQKAVGRLKGSVSFFRSTILDQPPDVPARLKIAQHLPTSEFVSHPSVPTSPYVGQTHYIFRLISYWKRLGIDFIRFLCIIAHNPDDWRWMVRHRGSVRGLSCF